MNRHIPEALRKNVTERAHHLCEYCLLHETDFYLAGHIDHIISIKHGGITSFENRIEERSLFIEQGSYLHPDALPLLNF